MPTASDALVLIAVAAGGAAAANVDLRTRRVPNALTARLLQPVSCWLLPEWDALPSLLRSADA